MISDLVTGLVGDFVTGLVDSGATTAIYSNVANHTNIPDGLLSAASASTNYVDHNIVMHIAGPESGYSQIRPVFHNGIYTNDVEQDGAVSFYLRAGLYYDGTWYPLTFNGSRDVLVDKAAGTVIADALDITIAAGGKFWISSRRIAELGASQPAFKWNYTMKVSGISQSGGISRADPTVDYTLGVGLPFGAEFVPTNVNGSNGLTTTTGVVSGGVNYVGSYSLQWYHGWAGRGNAGATIPGNSAGGYTNRTGDALTGVTITSAGTGYDTANKPTPYLVGGTILSYSERGVYSASAILGVASNAAAKSVLLFGDSYTAGGVISPDLVMTPYEYSLSDYSTHKIANNGTKALDFIQGNMDKRIAFFEQLLAWGYQPTHVCNAMGVNDYGNTSPSVPAETLATRIETINNYFRSKGCEIINVTLPPRTTSTDSWATTANQTVYSSDYALNGEVMQYNDLQRNETGITHDYLIDTASFWRDGTDTEKWPVALYGSAAATTDGVHPNGSARQLYKDSLSKMVLS